MPESASSFNSPVPPKLHLADVHSQLYQTPSTTSASSSLYRTISTSNRKRSRIDESGKPCPLYDSSVDDYDDDLQRSSWLGRRRDDAAEVDYDTQNNRGQLPLAPPIEASLDSLTANKPAGNSRKRSRGAWVGAAEQDMQAMDEKNGLSSSAPTSWSQSVINVVGKVWSFCWSGAFRGFHAGGGRGYQMPAGSARQLDEEFSSSWQHTSTEKPVAARAPATPGTPSGYYFIHHESTPVPGQFPDDSEIQQNWVVIPTDGAADSFSFDVENSRPSTPTKRDHHISDSPGSSQPRYKSAALPRVRKRISLSGQSTPTRIPMLSPGGGKPPHSPASVETQRYVAQMRRMEREEDASLRRLNRQLQTMIREGKQALGTQVELGDLDMDQDY